RRGLLEAGRLADRYLGQRMALGDKRAPCVQALEGELARYSSAAVDVNRLIACYHSFRLLAEEPGLAAGKKALAEAVPYGHYRDGYGQLVQRVHKDTPQEAWVLLPGVEEEAKALYARAVADGLSKEAVLDGVKAVLRRKAERDAEKARAAER